MRAARWLIGLSVWACASWAQAQASFCSTQTPQTKAEYAAQLACQEHQLWREPFINAQGQLLKFGPMEAERDALSDGTPAWRRVLHYWQNSVGLTDLFRGQQPPDYPEVTLNEAITRAQIVDTPWSGAFVSYLMRTAGFSESEFHLADGHIRYIKAAYAAQPNGAFHLRNPLNTPLQVGDLLCYVREGRRVFGPAGFEQWLAEHATDAQSLKMHCDVLVGVRKNRAYAVGGNVVQAVTMREIKLNARGALSATHSLPTRAGSWLVDALGENDAPLCALNALHQCDMNRQDWVTLLRYRP